MYLICFKNFGGSTYDAQNIDTDYLIAENILNYLNCISG